MDGLTFFKIFSIIKTDFIGKTLNKLAIYNDSIYLSLYNDRAYNLLFRASPEPPVFLMVEEFLGDNRSVFETINQSVIQKIFTVNYDRVGVIEISKRKSSGKLLIYKLIFEITGGYSNFFIIDEEDKILFSLSKKSIDPDRNVNLGSKYIFPRVNKRYSLNNFSGAESCNELIGFYPVTARYADDIIKSSATFSEGVSEILKRLETDEYFYIDRAGKVIPFYIDNFIKKITFLEINEYYKERRLSATDDTQLKVEILNTYASLLNKKRIILQKLSKEIILAEGYKKYYNEATLLKSNLYKISGAGSYEFDDYAENGDINKVAYHIKYNEDPNKIVDKLFNKGNKLKRSVVLINERIELISNEIFGLEEAIFLLADCDNIDELKRIKSELKDSDKNIKKKKNKQKTDMPFHIFKQNGFTLFLGRNSLSNHRLITNHAIDTDIWFHARLIPSAHLILRLDSGEDLTDEMVAVAAKLTASFSKKKHDSKVEIDYTQRKYIKKVAGASLGFVTYTNFKTITVQPFSKTELEKHFYL